MKGITLVKLFIVLTILPLMFQSCTKDAANNVQGTVEESVTPVSSEGKVIPNQYIVIMEDEAVAPAISYANEPFADREAKSQFIKEKSLLVKNELNAFLISQDINTKNVIAYYTAVMSGFAVTLTDEEYTRLSESDKIASLEHNREVAPPEFKVESVESSTTRAQTTPCGVTNARGPVSAVSSRWVWIVDSGIDLDHPDLNINTNYSVSYVGGTPNDCSGHGTHVAGTIGAVDNYTGVVGVAAGATLVAVRIFGCSNSSPTSTILSGLDHVAQYSYRGDVINMSLGGYYGSGCSAGSPYRSILKSLSSAGVFISVAAGNDASDAEYYGPACINAPNMVTVASMTCSKQWSSFSNYGSPCDYIATGSRVYSTYLNGGYATLSGTSMAAPHVAGIMQVRNGLPRSSGSIYYRGSSYPIAVK